jgi:hypothetical protein
MCAVLHGGVIWIFQNGGRKLFSFFSIIQLFFFFGKTNSFEISFFVFRYDHISLLMYRCLLPPSVTVKMDYKENMKNARYATNDDTPL